MTIKLGEMPEYIQKYINTKQTLEITHVGVSDKAVAVRVIGFPSTNKIPHVTVAVNVREGGKPAMSNEITDWRVVSDAPKLKGTVQEVK